MTQNEAITIAKALVDSAPDRTVTDLRVTREQITALKIVLDTLWQLKTSSRP